MNPSFFVRRFTRLAIVAEFKRASPSKGDIALTANVQIVTSEYVSIPGIAAVSVLTEPTYFRGSLEDLQHARKAANHESQLSGLPRAALLRKDFIIDEYQLHESLSYGADSVLLIVACLSENELRRLLKASRDLKMEPLVEVADEYEMQRALSVGATFIGVNARDLHTFQVSVIRAATVLRSATHHPGVTFMGLSGVKNRGEMEIYSGSGAHGVVIGEYLMSVDSIPRAVGSLLGIPSLPFLVKICGMCSVADAVSACDAGADVIGIIFAPASKRCMTLEQANPIVEAVRLRKHPALICGVFANQTREDVERISQALALDIVQFSGANDDVFVLSAGKTKTWAATHVRPDSNLTSLLSSRDPLIVPLLDTFDPNGAAGGTGKTFDWSSLRSIRGKRFVLAGGLNSGNVARAIQLACPFAVDVCSGVESSPRVKDARLVREFVRSAVRASLTIPTIAQVIRMLVEGGNPTPHEISSSIAACMLGPASSAQISAFLTSLAMRPDIQHLPTTLIACRDVLLVHALPFSVKPSSAIVVDIVGTGGDGHDTFNVSTASAMVVRAVARDVGKNVIVAKHGNRSSAGKCGSADFIEALGASLSVSCAQRAMDQTGFAFLFAPSFHPAMLAVKSVRKDIEIRTLFNLMGPLINPSHASHLVIGVGVYELGPLFAQVLQQIPKVQSFMIVHSENGLDEISPDGFTHVWEWKRGSELVERDISAADFGLPSHPLEQVCGGDPLANSSCWVNVLRDASSNIPVVDFVAMNAGAALVVTGIAKTLTEGAQMAKNAIASGTVRLLLEEYLRATK